uniref:Ribosomal protein L33 n=1 Tax=Romanomermis culicivorax TaxID=13658 RepID=A0A915JFA2_ROMCU
MFTQTFLNAHLYLSFPTERNGLSTAFSLKIHSRSERITAILRKRLTVTSSGTERNENFPFRSVKFRRLHSVPPKKTYKCQIRLSHEVN